MKSILVLCTGNSCRSQMAEGFLRSIGRNKVKVASAGVEAHGLNPGAVKVMKEKGIDIATQKSEKLDKYIGQSWDYIITVCDRAKESCPHFPGGKNKSHHDFSDPAAATGTEDEVLDKFRDVRDQIEEFCRNFIKVNVD